MKISAVCFDLGKVLLHFDWKLMLDRVAEKSPLTPEEISRVLEKDQNLIAYETGAITSDKFFSNQKKILKYKGTVKELRAAFSEIFTPLSDHIALAALLAPHYQLAIISNTNEAHIHHAEATYSFFSLFAVRIYSHQVKMMKPAPEIYRAALAGLGNIDPLEALFIDDLEPNILGAVKLGWQTIHLRPGVDLREALASYELKGLDGDGPSLRPVPLAAAAPALENLQQAPTGPQRRRAFLGKISARDPVLPGGLGDLLELVQSEEQNDIAFEKIAKEATEFGRRLAPFIFERLLREIDHDLLFTPLHDLVLPKIKAATLQALCECEPQTTKENISPWLVDVVSREVQLHLAEHRPS